MPDMTDKKQHSTSFKNQNIPLPPGVLKIKKGYNPNSSSIGTLVYAFPLAAAVVSGIIAILSAILSKQDKPPEEDQ